MKSYIETKIENGEFENIKLFLPGQHTIQVPQSEDYYHQLLKDADSGVFHWYRATNPHTSHHVGMVFQNQATGIGDDSVHKT